MNCLILDWAAGQPEDLAQQTSLVPLIKAGREMGISFTGRASVKDAEERGIATARGQTNPANCLGVTAGYYTRATANLPARSAPAENDSRSPRDSGYRVPRVVADLVAARPIPHAVIDGIESIDGGEGPWISGVRPVPPGSFIAGTNCVTTDAVAAALIELDPMADRGTAPFEKCDSTLRLGEELGVGTRDLAQIEVLGASLSGARFKFRRLQPRLASFQPALA